MPFTVPPLLLRLQSDPSFGSDSVNMGRDASTASLQNLQECVGQQCYVVTTIAQRRQLDMNHPYSHFEGDEAGAMNEFLAVAPNAVPFASQVGLMTSLNDHADREGRGLADGDTFSTGKKTWQWIDTPHVPHGWDCGVLFDQSTSTLLCGDLFTQPGAENKPVTKSEILTASEAMRKPMDYYAHSTKTGTILERLASLNPTTLACQHGSAYRGDGAALLRELAAILEKEQRAALK